MLFSKFILIRLKRQKHIKVPLFLLISCRDIILGDRKATAHATNHRSESYFDGPIIACDLVPVEGGGVLLKGKGNATSGFKAN